MSQSTTQPIPIPTRQEIRETLRQKVLEAVEVVIQEELSALLGSERYERSDERRGYRNGAQERTVTTEFGPATVTVPRARLKGSNGKLKEFHSEVLPRYARRTKKVDEAILGVYLGGGNTRRIKKALSPLLGSANLSKSAISRVVSRLKALFAQWRNRDLSSESYPYLFLDGFHLKVRLARRVVSVPVLVALGVEEDGSKHVVDLRIAMSESGGSWGEMVTDLRDRGLPRPHLLIADGHKGLQKAMELWPNAQVQRCALHKLRNLLSYCPKHAHPELKRDFHGIVYAKDGAAAKKAYEAFLRKWRKLCPQVAASLEEAGEHLMTFYRFPKPMWKALRTTNSIENLNREFRRRTKTQGAFTNEESALTLLYGLVAFGQITMRKIDGWRHMQTIATEACEAAA